MPTIPLSLPALANAFYCAAVVLGLPSITGLLSYAGYILHSRLAPANSSIGAVKNPDAILLMLKGMASVVQGFANVLGFLGRYVMTGIALLSVFGLVMAVGFWATGRGLHHQDPWARGLAGVIVGIGFLFSLFFLLATRGLPLAFAAISSAFCIVALVTLARGFPV